MKKIIVILATLVLLSSLILPTFAVGRPGEVILAGEVVLRIHYPAGKFTVQQRVDIVTERLNQFLGSEAFDPEMFKVEKRGSEYTVVYGKDVIITADKATAKINKTTPEALANIWMKNLKRVVPLAKATK